MYSDPSGEESHLGGVRQGRGVQVCGHGVQVNGLGF